MSAGAKVAIFASIGALVVGIIAAVIVVLANQSDPTLPVPVAASAPPVNRIPNQPAPVQPIIPKPQPTQPVVQPKPTSPVGEKKAPAPVFQPPQFKPEQPEAPKIPPVKFDPPMVEGPVKAANWTVQPDPGPKLAASQASPKFLAPLAGRERLLFPATDSPYMAVKLEQAGKEVWQILDLNLGKLAGQIVGKLNLKHESLSQDGKYLLGETQANNDGIQIGVFSVPEAKFVHAITVLQTDAVRAGIHMVELVEQNHLLAIRGNFNQVFFDTYDLKTGNHVSSFKDDSSGRMLGSDMTFSSGRKYVAYAREKSIKIYRLTTGELAGQIAMPHHHRDLAAMAFSHDGNELAASFSNKTLVFWKLADGTVARQVPVKHVNADHFRRQGRPLAWLADDSGLVVHNAYIVDKETGSEVAQLPYKDFEDKIGLRMVSADALAGVQKGVLGLIPIGKEALALAKRKLEEETALAKKKLEDETKLAKKQFEEDSKFFELPPLTMPVFMDTPAKALAVPETPWKVPAKTFAGVVGPSISYSAPVAGWFSEIDQVLFAKAERKLACVLSFRKSEITSHGDAFQVREERIDLNGSKSKGQRNLFAFALGQGASAAYKARFAGGPGGSSLNLKADLSPNGTRLAVRHPLEQGRVDIWNLDDGKHMVGWIPQDAKQAIDWIGFATDDLLLTSSGNRIAAWTVPECQAVYMIEGAGGLCWFSPQRKVVATAGAGGIAILDPATGSPLGMLSTGNSGAPQWVAPSPDGKQVAVAYASILVLVDAETGKETRTLPYAGWGHILHWIDDAHLCQGGFNKAEAPSVYHMPSEQITFEYTHFRKVRMAQARPDSNVWMVGDRKDSLSLFSVPMPNNETKNFSSLFSQGKVQTVMPKGIPMMVQVDSTNTKFKQAMEDNFKKLASKRGSPVEPGGLVIHIAGKMQPTGKKLGGDLTPLALIAKYGPDLYPGKKLAPSVTGKYGAIKKVELDDVSLQCEYKVVDSQQKVLAEGKRQYGIPNRLVFSTDNLQAEMEAMVWQSAHGFPDIIPLGSNVVRLPNATELKLPLTGDLP